MSRTFFHSLSSIVPPLLVTAILCLGMLQARAQTPVCTLSFDGPVEPPTLNNAARNCLNLAGAQYHSHSGSHIVLTGPIAARVSAARQYLIGNDAVPAEAILASTKPGDTGLVLVSLVFSSSPPVALPPAPLPAPPLPAPVDHSHPGIGQASGGGNASRTRAVPPPAYHPIPASAPAPAQAAAVHPSPQPNAIQPDPYAANEKVQDWESRLKSGAIDFNKPGTMVVGKPTGIVVVIHGYLDKTHTDLPGVVPQGSVKVSDSMRVDLEAPLAPGEFQITPAQGAKLPIPIDGSATWTFQVTPTNVTSDPQTLVVQPYLYPPGNVSEWPLQDQSFAVQVTVEPFWQHIRELWDDNPMKVVKYLLPGGAGFSGVGAFITGLIALLTSVGIIARIRRKIDPAGEPKEASSKSSE